MKEITSLNNPKVKNWIKLNNKKYRKLSNSFLIEGEHLVNEALKLNKVVELITTENNYNFPNTYLVTPSIMKSITSHKSVPKVIAVVNLFEEHVYKGNLLLVDELQDPGNLGTIIRTCVAFDIDTIVLGDNTVDVYNQKVISASEGMIFHLNIIQRNLIDFIDELKTKNYLIYGTDVNNGNSLKNINKNDLIALVIGNEGSGINKNILDKCDKNIYININDKCESLNVAVATGIILNHFKEE